jgi:hypothetical protein
MDTIDAVLIRDTQVTPALADPERTASDGLLAVLRGRIAPGARVAITAGSRGIANNRVLLRGLATAVRAAGGDPFFVPAMGSHGGGTGPGQREMLASLGVTQETVGAPIVSDMDVIEVGTTPSGVRVYCDARAARADAIVVANRVKPHTHFAGTIESGLLKMIAIGLGKAVGAAAYHAAFVPLGYEKIIREIAAVMFAKMPIVAGVAFVDDRRGGTFAVEAFAAEAIIANEERLLVQARELLSVLPFDELDLLVVDEMGKDLSGTGLDTNVTARAMDGRTQKVATPVINQIFVRDLTEHSQGNANGVGIADFCLRRLADKIDWQATNLNALTSASPAGARLPVVCASDREAVQGALVAAGVQRIADARVVRIKNTLHVDTMVVSHAALATIHNAGRYAVMGDSAALSLRTGDDFGAFPTADDLAAHA